MKSAAVLSLAFALGALAEPSLTVSKPALVERDLPTITNVVNQISDATAQFDNTVKAYNGGSTDQLLNEAKTVLMKVQSGTQTVQGTSNISVTDALTLQSVVQNLNSTTGSSIDDLVAKKPQLMAAGMGATVEDNLSQLLTSATDLANSISSKVPTELQSLAKQLSSGITSSISNGKMAFQSSGGSSGGGAAPSSSRGSMPSSSRSGSPTGSAGPRPSSPSSPATPMSGDATRTNVQSGGIMAFLGLVALL